MKRLTLYILIILFLTCGCTKSNLNSDETFSQPSNQEKITNHTISLNKEEPQPQEKEQKEELEENLHPIDKAERDCIEKQDSTQAMNECTYKARDAWYKEIDKYINLLKNVTSGYHYHTILADSEDILDVIQDELQQKGFLAKLQDYEPVDFWAKV